ncbi:MAG: hypothetical protein NTX82_04220 [Candidatus Parcubacteria bacterium]|nr:hypothetical protein [Candidatus Parcubacteria bacterium]
MTAKADSNLRDSKGQAVEIADIVCEIGLSESFLNSLPASLKEYLLNYGPIFDFFDPFKAWLIEKGLAKEYHNEISYCDPFKKSGWNKLAEGLAVIMIVKSGKANINDSDKVSKPLDKICRRIAGSSRAYIEEKDKEKKWVYDPNSVQHIFTIIIELDKLESLKALSQLFPEQIQIFPTL